MPFIEAPTTFYLGRRYDPDLHQMEDEVVYYDSRDLTTHAVVVGMTGSGKTGLCISMLEEAIIDNIPAIIIDPKGDITNLLLTFPQLRPEDFAPWINVDDARRAGTEPSEFAGEVAAKWRKGLADWDIVPGRLDLLKRSAQYTIYTPGSDSGVPISILNSLRAPSEGWVGHEEAHRERISGTVIALLALIGKNVQAVRDREHVLIANIFENAWRQGRDLTLEDIILQVQTPPFAKLGVFDVDTFFPEKDRFKLAMELNKIIAAPSFQTWLQGEALDIRNLLYTPDGRPHVSIFYIAHLNDAERTFMITLLLESMLSWMRTLSGTTSLRAILYFDEVFGFFPPAPYNPPTKEPLLRLLKQARAFGIGLILATQNPGDLDYKGLSNAGTWLIGKLQTDNDKQRVLSGLQGAATAETKINLDQLSQLLSSLDPRVFLLNNVHDDRGPVLVQTRWTMNYLRGPLTRSQVRTLMEGQRQALGLTAPNAAQQQYTPAAAPIAPAAPPVTPNSVPPPLTATMMPARPGVPRLFTSPSTTPPPLPLGVEPAVPYGATPIPPTLPEGASSPRIEPGSTVPPPTNIPQSGSQPRTFGSSVMDGATVAPGAVPQPAIPQPNQLTATQRGAALPDGFSNRPTAIPTSTSQFFLPTNISTQQAIRDWEKKFGYSATAFGGAQLLYRPVLLAQISIRYLDRKTNVEEEQTIAYQVPNLDRAGIIHWEEFRTAAVDPSTVSGEPFGEAFYGDLAPGLTDSRRLTALRTELIDYAYRTGQLSIYHNTTLDFYGLPNENRRDYMIRLQASAREARDAEIEKVTEKFDKELQKLDEKLRQVMRGLTYDKQSLDELKREDLYTTGEAMFNLLRGRPAHTLSRMSRTRRYKKQAQERTHGGEQVIAELEHNIENKQADLRKALQDVNDKWAKTASTIEEVKLTPYKKDIALQMFGIGWLPTWYTVINSQPLMLPAFNGSVNA